MTAFEHTALILEIPVTFRIATREDLPKLEWFGQYTHFRNLIRRSFREQVNGRRLLLVADFNGFPIGQVFIQFQSMNTNIADGSTRGYFYSFRVMDLFQNQGIGTRLLQEAETILIERGYRYVTLSVAKDNPDALRLYERNGYYIIGQDEGRWSYVDHRGVTRDVVEPCWMLEKSLLD
jgi:ribosomal protein S18 acetylase RimI-like enzyme